MAKTAAQRKAEEYARKRALGLHPFLIWLQPEEWPIVKRFIERLQKRRTK